MKGGGVGLLLTVVVLVVLLLFQLIQLGAYFLPPTHPPSFLLSFLCSPFSPPTHPPPSSQSPPASFYLPPSQPLGPSWPLLAPPGPSWPLLALPRPLLALSRPFPGPSPRPQSASRLLASWPSFLHGTAPAGTRQIHCHCYQLRPTTNNFFHVESISS